MDFKEILRRISSCRLSDELALTDAQIEKLLADGIDDSHRYMGGEVKLERYSLEVLLRGHQAGDGQGRIASLAFALLFYFENASKGPLPKRFEPKP